MHFYFITGTSSGIGKALAEQLLLREDVRVYGISRTSGINHPNYQHIFTDLSDAAQLNQLYPLFKKVYQQTDSVYLINNAAVIEPIRYAGDFSEQAIQQFIQVNLNTPVQLINAFLNIPDTDFQKRVILNVSSGAATKVIDGWSLYGSTKAALDHFSLHIAKELQIKGEGKTTVFSIAPGVVDTPMQEKIRNTAEENFSTVDRFNQLKQHNELVSASIISEKYIRILDQPLDFPNVIFSLRDIS